MNHRSGAAGRAALTRGATLGHFKIDTLLGAGGMGEVWRARDERLGRDVAIKVLPPSLAGDPERVHRFEKEARATGSLNHPNVLAIYDIGTHEGAPYLVEELLEGRTLRDVLRTGALPVRQAIEYAVQIAHGLAAAHDRGIVHRDLKPENLFLTSDGRVKILDFGLAKLREAPLAPEKMREASTLVASTEAGVVLGTPGYMAPEQVRGLPCDHRADVFALGCVLYEMLAGRQAFKGPTPADTISAILSKEPPPLSATNAAIPPALQAVVRQCLEKRPDDRFSSAHDLALALQASSGSGAVAELPPAVAPRRGRLLGMALLAVAGVGAALAIWRPWQATARAVATPSVLAVPCKVYGAPEVAFLTDAVPQTISTLLAQVEGLDTKVPPTAFEVEKVGGDLGRLAELYRVSRLIVTSVNASGADFALNVQLVDASTRKVLWGRQYEGPREAYNELARQAAEGIRQAAMPAAAPFPAVPVPSRAELALREGAFFLNRYRNLHRQPDFDAALAAYQRALKEDPSLAAAAAAISGLYLEEFSSEGAASGAHEEAEAWARRALALDPRCGRAWVTLSRLEWFSAKPDIARQLDSALKAASFAPRDALSHMTVSTAVSGPGALSLFLAASRRAAEIDPFYLPASDNVAVGLALLRRLGEGLAFAEHALRVEPDCYQCLLVQGYLLTRLGRFEEARITLARGEPRFLENPDAFHSQFWGQARFALAVAERDSATIARLEPHIVQPLLVGRANAMILGNAAVLVCPGLAHLGRTDESIRILLRSVDAGFPPMYDWLLLDPDLQALRSDPRFAQVLDVSRDGAAKLARVLGEARTRGELPDYLEQPLAELQTLLSEKGPQA